VPRLVEVKKAEKKAKEPVNKAKEAAKETEEEYLKASQWLISLSHSGEPGTKE
jgi:vacuolar-type H+-ATPase subunit H